MTAELNYDIRTFDKLCTRCLPYDLTPSLSGPIQHCPQSLWEIDTQITHITQDPCFLQNRIWIKRMWTLRS